MICPMCLSDGIEVRRDVKNRPYAVHKWCMARLFLQNDAVLSRLLEAQPGIAALVDRRGGALAMQAAALEPAPPGTSASSECRCPVCLTAGGAAVRFDKRQRPFTFCRACGARVFVSHPLGLTAVRLQTPGLRLFLAAAMGAGQTETQREAAPGAAREVA